MSYYKLLLSVKDCLAAMASLYANASQVSLSLAYKQAGRFAIDDPLTQEEVMALDFHLNILPPARYHNSQPPTAKGQPPTAKGQPPTAKGQPPTAKGQQLKANNQRPKANS